MKIAFKRAEQGIKSKTKFAKIDASTTEVQQSISKVERIIKTIPKGSPPEARRR